MALLAELHGGDHPGQPRPHHGHVQRLLAVRRQRPLHCGGGGSEGERRLTEGGGVAQQSSHAVCKNEKNENHVMDKELGRALSSGRAGWRLEKRKKNRCHPPGKLSVAKLANGVGSIGVLEQCWNSVGLAQEFNGRLRCRRCGLGSRRGQTHLPMG